MQSRAPIIQTEFAKRRSLPLLIEIWADNELYTSLRFFSCYEIRRFREMLIVLCAEALFLSFACTLLCFLSSRKREKRNQARADIVGLYMLYRHFGRFQIIAIYCTLFARRSWCTVRRFVSEWMKLFILSNCLARLRCAFRITYSCIDLSLNYTFCSELFIPSISTITVIIIQEKTAMTFTRR